MRTFAHVEEPECNMCIIEVHDRGLTLYACTALLQELSQEYGFDFDILTADIDERGIGDRTRNPETLVSLLADAKAQSLIQQLQGIQQDAMRLLITCDQVVVSSTGTILEKPLNADEVCTASSVFPGRA